MKFLTGLLLLALPLFVCEDEVPEPLALHYVFCPTNQTDSCIKCPANYTAQGLEIYVDGTTASDPEQKGTFCKANEDNPACGNANSYLFFDGYCYTKNENNDGVIIGQNCAAGFDKNAEATKCEWTCKAGELYNITTPGCTACPNEGLTRPIASYSEADCYQCGFGFNLNMATAECYMAVWMIALIVVSSVVGLLTIIGIAACCMKGRGD